MEAMHTTFPPDLPIPVDDGACAHLMNINVPNITLVSTLNTRVNIAALDGLTIVFCYPRTGAPGEVVPKEWDMIPGARGCTPQACSFRDASAELLSLGVKHIYGLSTQDHPYQVEVRQRLDLPYQLLSDESLEFVGALGLPTFGWDGKELVKRLTIAVRDGKVVQTWYPIFPPDGNANQVIEWLKKDTAKDGR